MSAILSKITALLARAAHATTPEEEARTSAHVAARLISQHGVKLTLNADGAAHTIAEAEARARAAEARAEAAETRARAAETRAESCEAPKGEAAPKSERRARKGRRAARAGASGKSSNPRAGEAPSGERKGARCEGQGVGSASCGGAPNPRASSRGAGGAPHEPSEPREPREYAKRIVIPARYRGFCAECDGAFEVGESISWRKGGKTYHEACTPMHQAAAA
jgi:Protein of unknown function (DUF2786)